MSDGLSSLNLSLFDAPKALPGQADQGEDQPAPVITRIKKTRSGRDILVCSVCPAPPDALKIASDLGLALFTPAEIETMRGCHADLVDKIIEVKVVFPGADVAKVIQEQTEAAH